MAYSDTLFQLGMDLTRSSPAQEEDSIDQVQALHGDRTNDCVANNGSRLYLNLAGAKMIGSVKTVEYALVQALEFMKASAGKIEMQRADRRGWISGHVTLADGHVKIDACPAKGMVAVDVVSRSGVRPEIAMTGFVDAFKAREVTLKKERTETELARMRKPVVQLQDVPSARQGKARPAAASKFMRAAAA